MKNETPTPKETNVVNLPGADELGEVLSADMQFVGLPLPQLSRLEVLDRREAS